MSHELCQKMGVDKISGFILIKHKTFNWTLCAFLRQLMHSSCISRDVIPYRSTFFDKIRDLKNWIFKLKQQTTVIMVLEWILKRRVASNEKRRVQHENDQHNLSDVHFNNSTPIKNCCSFSGEATRKQRFKTRYLFRVLFPNRLKEVSIQCKLKVINHW